MKKFTATITALGFILFFQSSWALTEKEVREIIDQHLINNPEIIEKAMEALNKKKLVLKQAKNSKAIKDNAQVLYTTDNSLVLGSPSASKSIVVFVDPYCGYCQRYHKILEEALATDTSFKAILKDIPLFGEPSQLAIQALWAAKQQGKYTEFYKTLVEKDKPQQETELLQIAHALGLNEKQFQADMTSAEALKALQANSELSQKLDIRAAPTIVVGTQIIEGIAPLNLIKSVLK